MGHVTSRLLHVNGPLCAQAGRMNMYVGEQGQVVYLKVTPEVLCKHLKMGKTERPLLKGKTEEELLTFVTTQLASRSPFYEQANYTLDVSLMDNYEKIKITVAELLQLLKPVNPI